MFHCVIRNEYHLMCSFADDRQPVRQPSAELKSPVDLSFALLFGCYCFPFVNFYHLLCPQHENKPYFTFRSTLYFVVVSFIRSAQTWNWHRRLLLVSSCVCVCSMFSAQKLWSRKLFQVFPLFVWLTVHLCISLNKFHGKRTKRAFILWRIYDVEVVNVLPTPTS